MRDATRFARAYEKAFKVLSDWRCECVCVCVSKLFELTKYKVLKDKGEHTFLFTSLTPLYNKVDMFSNNWFSTLISFYRGKGT